MKFTNGYDKQLLVQITSVKFVQGNFLQQHVTAVDCLQVTRNVASDGYHYLSRGDEMQFVNILTFHNISLRREEYEVCSINMRTEIIKMYFL